MLATNFERNEPKGYGEKGLVSLQNLIQQEGGVAAFADKVVPDTALGGSIWMQVNHFSSMSES